MIRYNHCPMAERMRSKVLSVTPAKATWVGVGDYLVYQLSENKLGKKLFCYVAKRVYTPRQDKWWVSVLGTQSSRGTYHDTAGLQFCLFWFRALLPSYLQIKTHFLVWYNPIQSYWRQKSHTVIFFLKIILFSIFVIFNNFHKQHKCNNRLTNNSINNCSFCFLFTPFFWKFFRA